MSTEIIELIVDKALAKVIRENGLAEIVLRQKNARFKSMIKCSLPGDTSEKTLEKALEKVSEHIDAKKIRKGLANLRSTTNTIDKKLSLLTDSIGNISDSITSLNKATDVVKKVAYLNVAINVINIFTTVAGITYLSKQLNEIKVELQTITQGIEKLTNIEKSKMTEQYNELALKILNLSQKIADKERVPLHVYEDLLSQLNPFILKLVESAKDDTFPLMDVMSIIIHLLPAYTMVLEEYTKAYYSEKGKIPVIQGHYASLYDSLDDEALLKKIHEHVFLVEKLSLREAIDTVNIHELMLLQQKQQLEDTNKFLTSSLTKEEKEAVIKSIDEYTKAIYNQYAPTMA